MTVDYLVNLHSRDAQKLIGKRKHYEIRHIRGFFHENSQGRGVYGRQLQRLDLHLAEGVVPIVLLELNRKRGGADLVGE